MNQQMMYDVQKLPNAVFDSVQQELGITYHRGVHEKEVDFRNRVLTEVSNAGNIRILESLLVGE